MLSEFNFDTPIERAYAQAMRWDAARVWRRAQLSVRRREFGAACAQLLVLAHKYSSEHRSAYQQAQTIESLTNLLKYAWLDPCQKQSLCKICRIIVLDLFDSGETVHSPHVYALVSVITNLILSVGKPGLEVVAMLKDLGQIYERPVPLSEVLYLDATIRVSLMMDQEKGPRETEEPKQLVSTGPHSSLAATAEDNTARPEVPATRAERLELLHQELALALERYGLHSQEGTAAVVRLAQFHVSAMEQKEAMESLRMLAEVMADYSVEITRYQLREVHTLAGNMHGFSDAHELVRTLEQEALIRKEMLVGFDSNITADLFRLAKLWERSGALDDAQKICSDLLVKAASKLDLNGFVYKQIKSAEHRIKQMLDGSKPIPSSVADLRFCRYKDPEEFVFMVTLSAFDHIDANNEAAATQALNELIVYHNDCISDDARRVREMLWLLTETRLRHVSAFVDDLLKITPQANPNLGPVDEYNDFRYRTHTRRLLRLRRIDELLVDGKFNVTEKSLQLTNIALIKMLPRMTTANLEQFNAQASLLVDALAARQFYDEAKVLLRLLLAMNIQSHEHVNRIRVRMAEICIDQGELFEGCAVILSALCDIPDAGDESKPVGPGDCGTNLLEMR